MLREADLPPFETAAFLDVVLRESPELYPVVERSPLARNLSAARADGKKLVGFSRLETAAAWYAFWKSAYTSLDSVIPDFEPKTSLHRFAVESYRSLDAASHNLLPALTSRYSSVFEMFDIAEYAELFEENEAGNRPTYQLVAPLFSYRPSVEELTAVPPGIRRTVTTLLQPGFGVSDAVAWVNGRIDNGPKLRNEAVVERQRYAALISNGVPAEEAIRLVFAHPLRDVGVLLAAYENGIPVDYMEAM